MEDASGTDDKGFLSPNEIVKALEKGIRIPWKQTTTSRKDRRASV